VLIVDNSEYKLSDFTKDLALRLSQLNLLTSKNPSVIQVLKNRLLSDFIITQLIKEDLESQKIYITESEIDEAIKKLEEPYQSSLSFKEELLNSNVSEKQFRELVANELKVKKFFSKLQLQIQPPTETECLEFYNRKRGEYYLPLRIYLKQIVVKEKHQAEEILTALKDKSNSFEDLAKKYSIGPESVNGGIIGWVEENQISIFDPAFKLKPGHVSNPVESGFGFHIFKVEKKAPKQQLKFAEVKDKIFHILLEEQEQGLFLKWLDERLRRIKIKKDDQLMNALIVETRGE
jgi:parvulin-like peptidyl-prolyl isomerase